MDRADIVHANFLRRVAARDFPVAAPSVLPLDKATAVLIYRAQCLSRALDRTSRAMQRAGEGFYTIGSSGHEGMAAVAAALRPTDMAFLHYRDAAFQILRSSQVPGQTITWDMLLSFASSSEDPISGGRHKVLGSKVLFIPPQTSTIASHLPKALGVAYSIGLAKRLEPEHQVLPADSLIVCSFGDASANHATAQAALNTAGWTSYQGVSLPLLFICEDNGIGISTKTPSGWIKASLSQRTGLRYFTADGLNMFEAFAVAEEASYYVRFRRKPAILHLKTIRLYGHAGADVPTTYLTRQEVEAEEAQDPLLHSVRLLDETDVLGAMESLSIYEETQERVARCAAEVVKRPRLKSAIDVMTGLLPPPRECRPKNGPSADKRIMLLNDDMAAQQVPQPMMRLINWALTDLMLAHREIVLMGEDIGRKGGVYGITQKLQARFGADRVIDTLLDEQSILGLAIGLAHNGFIPVPEIQFLAYLHNAEDQLRGEAATLSFFSNGQFTNPLVLRIAGLGYQKGFGGHFHNDNSVAVLRDLPGVILACPSNGVDAVLILRECIRLAREQQRVCVFLEPIALYNTRDLHGNKDNGWATIYPPDNSRLTLGEVGVHGDGTDVVIVSYGNGYYLSRQAEPALQAAGVSTRMIDLRWLSPLPEEKLLKNVTGCRSVLVVDECRRSGGPSEAIMALLAGGFEGKVIRIAAEDSFIATGPAYAATLPSASSIAEAAINLKKSLA